MISRVLTTLIASTSILHSENADPELVFDRPLGNPEQVAFHAHLGWESRYVSEGRDNLDGDGIFTGTFELGWKQLSFGAWYANSPQSSYDEFQLSAAVSQEWGDFEAYFAYAYLDQPDNGTHDNEIGLGAAWHGLPYELVIALDSYFSFEASGAFIELTLGRDFQINECLTLSPSMTFGVNQGYISDGHDGANHFAVNLESKYAFTETFSVEAHVAYNFAIDRNILRPGDQALKDFFHVGAGLVWTF